MANRRDWVVELIAQIVAKAPTSAASKTAEIIVERLTEEGILNLGYGNADVDMVVNTFTETFGTTKVSKYDRFAAQRLSAKYGAQAVRGIIRLLGQGSTEKFAPIVNSVADLETKWVSVLNFLRKHKGEEIIDV